MADVRTNLKVTTAQAAELRALLFKELATCAGQLAEQCGVDVYAPSDVMGEDALGMYRSLVSTAELLDIVGWSTRGDLERAVATERARRQDDEVSA